MVGAGANVSASPADISTIYTSHPPAGDPVGLQDDESHLLLRMAKTGGQRKYGQRIAVRRNQPALTQIMEHKRVVRPHKELTQAVVDILAGMRFTDLSPDRMRAPAFPGQTVLGDRGENLPTVLRSICEDAQRRRALADWTRELTPMDVKDFEFIEDPITGRVQLAFREANGEIVSAYAASDGTLRFLAVLAALLGPDRARLYVFEEIDNGIHPSRQQLLLDLIEGQTRTGPADESSQVPSGDPIPRKDVQVVTTTHSPDLLSSVSDDTFENTSAICRSPGTSDAVIRPVCELPHARKLRSSQGLGTLHRSGWMENVIHLERDDERDETDGDR